MKKFRREAELFKAALIAAVAYAEGRKAVEFEATDSASDKALYVYRLLEPARNQSLTAMETGPDPVPIDPMELNAPPVPTLYSDTLPLAFTM
jgi:hypothetical protein